MTTIPGVVRTMFRFVSEQILVTFLCFPCFIRLSSLFCRYTCLLCYSVFMFGIDVSSGDHFHCDSCWDFFLLIFHSRARRPKIRCVSNGALKKGIFRVCTFCLYGGGDEERWVV